MKKYFTVLLLLLYCISAFPAPLVWQILAPGLEYAHLTTFSNFENKGFYIFRFDLQHYQLQLAFTQTPQQTASVADLVRANHAVIGINGGFFTPDLKPLGLRIDQGKIKSPLRNTAWWGIFFTRGEQAFIVAPRAFKADKNINFAVQSGPRLIINGRIPSLKPGVANRTALGITRDNKIILLVTSHFPLTTDELAAFMQASEAQGGLACVNALNLDGGSSTQLYATLNDFTLNIPSFAQVTDAVLVVPR